MQFITGYCDRKIFNFISLIAVLAIFSFAHFEMGKLRNMRGDTRDYIAYKLRKIFIFSGFLITIMILLNFVLL